MGIYPLRYDTSGTPSLSEVSGVPVIADGVPGAGTPGFHEWGGEAVQFLAFPGIRGQLNAGQNVFSVKDPAYGAKGDGATDDTTAILNAVATAKASKGRVHFPHGQYRVTASIITAATSAATFAGITFSGESGAWGYDGAVLSSVLVADANFANGTAVLDLRYTTQTAVRDLAIDMSACVNQVTGIEYGDRALLAFYSNHLLENCTIHHGYNGIRANNAGLIRARSNNISAHTNAGVYLQNYAGDSDFEGNYVNTNTGYGYFLGTGSGNTNIRGGKCEWNAYGIGIYDAQGVTIAGVQFDTNNYYHVGISCDVATTGLQPRSINVAGCRFLGGGTLDGGSVMGKAAIAFNIGSNNLRLVVTGNTFRKAGTGASDYDTTGTVGPLIAAIRGSESGGGAAVILAHGNDLTDCSTYATYSITGDANCVLDDYLNERNLFIETFSTPTIRVHRPGVSVALTDGATVTPNVPEGADVYTLSAGGSRTIAAPTNAVNGQEFTLELLNSSGGAMTTTWNAAYALAGGTWTDPANGKRRRIRFVSESGTWREQWRTSGDV